MKIGFFDIKDILDRTLFNKELFKLNFVYIAAAVLFNFITLFFVQHYRSVLLIVEPVVQLITALLILYALLNATHIFIQMSKPRIKSASMTNVSAADFGRFLLVILIYLLLVAAALALLMLTGFISRIPVVGIYLFGGLTPVLLILFVIFAFFAAVTGKLINAAYLENKDKGLLDILKELIVLPLKNPVKTFFNLMLSFVVVYLPLLTGLLILFGISFILLFSIWQVMGLSYLFTLSVQAATNFVAFFIIVSQGLMISLALTLVLNSFAGISYSIYKDLK